MHTNYWIEHLKRLKAIEEERERELRETAALNDMYLKIIRDYKNSKGSSGKSTGYKK